MNEALFESRDPAPLVVMLQEIKMYCGLECLPFKWPQDLVLTLVGVSFYWLYSGHVCVHTFYLQQRERHLFHIVTDHTSHKMA